MKMYKIIFSVLVAITCQKSIAQSFPEDYTLQVESWSANSEKKTMGTHKMYPTRSVATLKNFDINANIKLDKYGGRKDMHVKATGFYYATKINGRWWTVDPLGNLFINVGLVNVGSDGSDKIKVNLKDSFATKENWTVKTQTYLQDLGFNSLGAWSDYAAFKQSPLQQEKPISYTIIKNFMSSYGASLKKVHQESGHMGYPDRTIFVFDPGFEPFCDNYAKDLAENKNDPNLFGYFSDNELPFEKQSIDRYLGKKDTTDFGYIAAKKWLEKNGISPQAITDSVRADFVGYMADTYFSIVSKAIKKYDPNHLYLGSRLHHTYEKKLPQMFKAAGKYVDVIAVNYYREWAPTKEDVTNWEAWSGKPFIITEWYTKGMDSKMPNYSGAGWVVNTQEDRGLFYQNFALGLLESKNCVGFHWFKYMDNDSTNLKSDPSNRDANKGIVDVSFRAYKPLTDKMKELNNNVYAIIDFFDRRRK